ncbi:MAG TPA: phage portal protein [Acidimicrobiales bacterium]|nr:phage portal protein [Acidimicrobiales bacterium]
MPLSRKATEALARELMEIRQGEKPRLDLIHDYLIDDPDKKRPLGGLPSGTPDEVTRLARISRVNVLKYLVNARVQAMYVDGFQTPTSGDNLAQWDVWQRNRFDARQIGVHRAAMSYGAGYVVVLPGDPVPVLRGASPRQLTAAYGADDEWPTAVLWQRRDGRWWLLDREAIYVLAGAEGDTLTLTGDGEPHGATYNGDPVCPAVRYRDTDDLDDPVRGIVQPHIPLQDQINVTSFGLQVAQHYGAFRKRAIIGWLAKDEEEKLKAGASSLWTFEDSPGEIQIWESQQTDLRGYIESREASVRHMAVVSQTAVHELSGQFVNLSAEALEAAKASHYAAIEENRTVCGESHEQTLNLSGEYMGIKPDPAASVMWRDTRVRSLNDAAQALGTLVEKLGVPPRALWQRIPGVPQHETDQWEALADEADPFMDLTAALDRATTPAAGGSGTPGDAADLKQRFDALGVAIRSGVDPDDAARRLGLEGVKFTGAIPVSLRPAAADARELEQA